MRDNGKKVSKEGRWEVANFEIVVIRYQVPWPFSWGPFRRDVTSYLSADEAVVNVYQAGGLQEPIELGCHSGRDECTTTVDFREGSRLKRRTRISGGTK